MAGVHQSLDTERAPGARPLGGALLRTLAAALVAGGLWLLPRWWNTLQSHQYKLDALWLTAWAAGMAGAVLVARRRRAVSGACVDATPKRGLSPEAWILGSVVVFFTLTTVIHLGRYYFIAWPCGPSSPRTMLRSGVLRFVLLSWALLPVFLVARARRGLGVLLLLLLVGGQALCAVALLWTTEGLAVYSDDHPSFMFRIAEFWGSFPWRENYVPHWNAGIVNSVLVSSGTTGYAWAAAPLWWLFEPHVVYTVALIAVQIVAVPWVTVWALRTLGLGREGAVAGGILSLCAGRLCFVWMLHFGTAGAALSWAMLPAAFAFLFAVAVRRQRTLATFVGLVLSMFFLAQWPPSMVAGIPFLALVVSSRRRWMDCRARWVLGGGGLLVVALLTHTLVVAALGKDLLAYTLTPSGESASAVAVLRKLHDIVAPGVVELHPLVAVFGVAGVWFLPWKRLRRWTVVTLVALAVVFSAGPVLAPRMQLERMAIAAGALAIIPAACWLRRVWSARAPSAAILQSLTLALLALGVVNTARIYGGQGFAPFTALQPSVQQLADWVRSHVPEDGRLLFAGRAVHAYGRGHIAYLPILAGREMMACDYYGFPVGMVEMDYPPRAARDRPGGLHGFMRLHGVSHVVTYHKNYIDYFRSEPNQFREATSIASEAGGVFVVFEVLGGGGKFLEGEGSVKADFNRWTVTFPEVPPTQAVIAYNWHDRLRADAPAVVFPHDTGLGATFIGIRPNGARQVIIRYNNRF